MKTVATDLYVDAAFRNTEKAYGFVLENNEGRRVDVYVPKSQALVLPSGRIRVAPWLRRAVSEKQGVTI